jgi:ParB-like chromosome segregation protein Spo0J
MPINGHHRLAALRKVGIKEIDVPVRDLSDTDMAKIMAHENMQEWGSSAEIEQETIRAIIDGYAAGRIKMDMVANSAKRVRYAPFFSEATEKTNDLNEGRPSFKYTAETLRKFLGWEIDKVKDTLNALAATEEELVDRSDYNELTTSQAEEVTRLTRLVEREVAKRQDAKTAKAAAKRVAKKLADGMRKRTITIRDARKIVDDLIASYQAPTHKPLPDAAKFIDGFVRSFMNYPTEKMVNKLNSLYEVRADLPAEPRRSLAGSLRGAATRLNEWADKG